MKGEWGREKATNKAFKYSNEGIHKILKTTPLYDSINTHHLKYIGQVSQIPKDAIPNQFYLRYHSKVTTETHG